MFLFSGGRPSRISEAVVGVDATCRVVAAERSFGQTQDVAVEADDAYAAG